MIDYKRILFDKSIYEINLLPQTSNFHRFEDETALKKNIESERDFNDGWKRHRLSGFLVTCAAISRL